MFFISDHKKRRLSGFRASRTHWGEAGGIWEGRGGEGRKREVEPGGEGGGGPPLHGGSGSQR